MLLKLTPSRDILSSDIDATPYISILWIPSLSFVGKYMKKSMHPCSTRLHTWSRSMVRPTDIGMVLEYWALEFHRVCKLLSMTYSAPWLKKHSRSSQLSCKSFRHSGQQDPEHTTDDGEYWVHSTEIRAPKTSRGKDLQAAISNNMPATSGFDICLTSPANRACVLG